VRVRKPEFEHTIGRELPELARELTDISAKWSEHLMRNVMQSESVKRLRTLGAAPKVAQ